MAVRLLADLCLGKPPLRPLRSISSSTTVADALAALKSSDENFISVWKCDHSLKRRCSECLCIGKICTVDIVLYLCRGDNLFSSASALKAPIYFLLKNDGRVKHVDPNLSLLDGIHLLAEGAQNLVVPIQSSTPSISKKKEKQIHTSVRTLHKGQEFCWITQEDVIRYLVGSISHLSPLPSMSVGSLGIIIPKFLSVRYNLPAMEAISRSLAADQTSVAVVNCQGILIGEISPLTLACYDESMAPAVLTLTAGELMTYIDCGGPSEETLKAIKARMKEKLHANEFLKINSYLGDFSSSSDCVCPTGNSQGMHMHSRSNSRSARKAEAIVCHSSSSLLAVMIQATSHRVNSVWVIEKDWKVVGIVTLGSMLKCLRDMMHVYEQCVSTPR